MAVLTTKVPDALAASVRARAKQDRRTVSALVRGWIDAGLAQVALEAFPHRASRGPGKTNVLKQNADRAVARIVPPVDDELCTRHACRHPKAKHWSKGCATPLCTCNERRFIGVEG